MNTSEFKSGNHMVHAFLDLCLAKAFDRAVHSELRKGNPPAIRSAMFEEALENYLQARRDGTYRDPKPEVIEHGLQTTYAVREEVARAFNEAVLREIHERGQKPGIHTEMHNDAIRLYLQSKYPNL